MNKPVAWTEKDLRNACRNARLSEDDFFRIKAYLPVDTHTVKEKSNLVNVVKDHIEDLWRCVKTFRSYEMDNTADELEVAIKELKDAIEAHPVKKLTESEIYEIAYCHANLLTEVIGFSPKGLMQFAKAILRKVQEK